MKRFAALTLALALILAVIGSALAEVTFTTKYFTLTLPDGWEIDTEDLEKEDNMEALGLVAAPEDKGLAVAAYLVYDEASKDQSLWNKSDEELKAYAEAVMEDYQDEKPEYLGIIKAGSIPFVLIKATDSESEYLYADTLTNGYYIMFQAYIADEKNFYPLTDEAVEQFKTILATFTPVT